MNKLEYISLVTSSVHDAVEGWARGLLREAGIETTEVYGQFPPEGSVASHIVLFPYRLGTGDAQLARPNRSIILMGPRSTASREIPDIWKNLGQQITRVIRERFPVMEAGPRKGQPHPAPQVKQLPDPLRDWYTEQGPDSVWVNDIGGNHFSSMPSLTWEPGITLKLQYLAVVGVGARGTSERQGPLAIQALSAMAAGAQFQRNLIVRVPPIPYQPELYSFAQAVCHSLNDPESDVLLEQLQYINKKANMSVTLFPGGNLTNADFTGLMQALQRPLQPTLHFAVQINVGGGPIFCPGIMPDIASDRKERRPQGRA